MCTYIHDGGPASSRTMRVLFQPSSSETQNTWYIQNICAYIYYRCTYIYYTYTYIYFN